VAGTSTIATTTPAPTTHHVAAIAAIIARTIDTLIGMDFEPPVGTIHVRFATIDMGTDPESLR
jgi:hypothetical protein